MAGAPRIIPFEPLGLSSPKTASDGKIRARRFAPEKTARNQLYGLRKTCLCRYDRVGQHILANTIGNAVANGIASSQDTSSQGQSGGGGGGISSASELGAALGGSAGYAAGAGMGGSGDIPMEPGNRTPLFGIDALPDTPSDNGEIVVTAPRTSAAENALVQSGALQTIPNIVLRRGHQVLLNPVIDYQSINDNLGTSVDFQSITSSEGGVYMDSYVPWSPSSDPKNHSGVTIVGGLDLGGKNADYFDGLPQSIIDKLSPAFGLRQQDAVDWNNSNGVHLTVDETQTLQTFMTQKYLEGAVNNFNENSLHSNLTDLSSGQQTVFYDRFFNAGLHGIASGFFAAAYQGNWNSAGSVLRNAAISNPTWAIRLNADANIIAPPAVKR